MPESRLIRRPGFLRVWLLRKSNHPPYHASDVGHASSRGRVSVRRGAGLVILEFARVSSTLIFIYPQAHRQQQGGDVSFSFFAARSKISSIGRTPSIPSIPLSTEFLPFSTATCGGKPRLFPREYQEHDHIPKARRQARGTKCTSALCKIAPGSRWVHCLHCVANKVFL